MKQYIIPHNYKDNGRIFNMFQPKTFMSSSSNETKNQYAQEQAVGAYTSNQVICMKNKYNVCCTNVFNDTASKSFNELWAEVISSLENTKYEPMLDQYKNTLYNISVQSCSYQNQMIEVSSR